MRSSHPMHVHLYKVSADKALPSLGTLLGNLTAIPMKDRVRRIDIQEYRLDEAHSPSRHWQLWRLAICKFRADGPGLATRATPSKSIILNDDQEFTEDTAVLFDPAQQVVVMQYNHHGPRANAIAEYLSLCAGVENSIYRFAPQLNSNAQARLNNKRQFTRVSLRVAPSKLTDDWKRNNVAMASALESNVSSWGADWVTLVVSLDGHDQKSTLRIRDKLKALIGLADEPRDAVKELKISGRDDVGLRIDPIDLLAERLERTYNGLPLDTGRRVPMDNRWKALHDAYTHWKQDGLI